MGFGTVMMAVAVAGIYILQKRRLARRRLGDPRVEISPVHAHAGERVRVSVILRPPQDLELERASIALKGLERALTSESRNWVKHQFHRHDTALSAPPRLTAGQDVHLAGELTVPAVAAPSFDADSNYVNWSIELKVEPRGWPAWQREFPIVVWL
jgi:hypothetical protein